MRRKADQLIPLEVEILDAAVALHRRGTTAFHGYALAKVMKAASARPLFAAYGTLYRALHRMERAGLIESFWEDAALAEQDGRPRRRMYHITAAAEPALSRARARQGSAARLRKLDPGVETP